MRRDPLVNQQFLQRCLAPGEALFVLQNRKFGGPLIAQSPQQWARRASWRIPERQIIIAQFSAANAGAASAIGRGAPLSWAADQGDAGRIDKGRLLTLLGCAVKQRASDELSHKQGYRDRQ